MASSNVEYYEKQRDLQNTITYCEQQRMDLERQLQIALKADQTSSKMKASRLHTYWRKICEDERKAKQRNEMLMRDFERIDVHMSELNARTQKLALMKKQYEEYISRTYPKWNELVHGSGSTQQTEHLIFQPQKTSSDVYPQHSPLPEKEQQKQQQQVASATSISNKHQQWQNKQTTQEKNSYTQQVVSNENKETYSAVYANISNSQVGINQKAHQTETPKHGHVRHHEETLSQDFKNVDVKSDVSGTKVETRNTMLPEEGDDEEETSDFGSDSDLPMGQSLGNTQIRVDTQPALGKNSSLSKINGSTKPELSVDGLLNLLHLVEMDVVDAFSCEDYYRRSSLPDTTGKNDIIRKANNNGDLSRLDTSTITMIILEQMTYIVQSLPEKCLLPENLLQNVSSLTVVTLRQHLSPEAQVIWDAVYAHFLKLVQYDVMKPQELSAIFTPCLVADRDSLDKGQKFISQFLEGTVTSANEISAANNVNKTINSGQVMDNSGSFMEDGKVPPLKFGSLLDKPFSDDESSYVNSSIPRDSVPLNETEAYKSMISLSGGQHRQLSGQDDTDDDVEKQIASSLVRKPVRQTSPQKRIAEVDDPSETSSQTFKTSPHVYVPAAMEQRQTINPSRTTPSKFQGIKISSDLDTDTEVDAGIFGSSRRPEDNSDFDFYD